MHIRSGEISKETPLESYVIHIYRRVPGDPKGIIGTVEIAGAGKEQAFHSLREVCDILMAPTKRRRRKRLGGTLPPDGRE